MNSSTSVSGPTFLRGVFWLLSGSVLSALIVISCLTNGGGAYLFKPVSTPLVLLNPIPVFQNLFYRTPEGIGFLLICTILFTPVFSVGMFVLLRTQKNKLFQNKGLRVIITTLTFTLLAITFVYLMDIIFKENRPRHIFIFNSFYSMLQTFLACGLIMGLWSLWLSPSNSSAERVS